MDTTRFGSGFENIWIRIRLFIPDSEPNHYKILIWVKTLKERIQIRPKCLEPKLGYIFSVTVLNILSVSPPVPHEIQIYLKAVFRAVYLRTLFMYLSTRVIQSQRRRLNTIFAEDKIKETLTLFQAFIR